MKHTITSLHSLNEPSQNDSNVLGNYTLEYFFGQFSVEFSPIWENQQQELDFQKFDFSITNVSYVDSFGKIKNIL